MDRPSFPMNEATDQCLVYLEDQLQAIEMSAKKNEKLLRQVLDELDQAYAGHQDILRKVNEFLKAFQSLVASIYGTSGHPGTVQSESPDQVLDQLLPIRHQMPGGDNVKMSQNTNEPNERPEDDFELTESISEDSEISEKESEALGKEVRDLVRRLPDVVVVVSSTDAEDSSSIDDFKENNNKNTQPDDAPVNKAMSAEFHPGATNSSEINTPKDVVTEPSVFQCLKASAPAQTNVAATVVVQNVSVYAWNIIKTRPIHIIGKGDVRFSHLGDKIETHFTLDTDSRTFLMTPDPIIHADCTYLVLWFYYGSEKSAFRLEFASDQDCTAVKQLIFRA